MLEAEARNGAVFHYEDGEQPMAIDEIFVLQKIE